MKIKSRMKRNNLLILLNKIIILHLNFIKVSIILIESLELLMKKNKKTKLIFLEIILKLEIIIQLEMDHQEIEME